MSYSCLICGESVDESVLVDVFLKLPDQKEGEGTPFLLNISPCCGKRACAEAAWEQAKLAVIGDIEIGQG